MASFLHKTGSRRGTKGEKAAYHENAHIQTFVVRLPLDPIMLMISELLPKVQEIQSSSNKANTTPAIIDFLRSASIQNALPETPSPPTRRFMVSCQGSLYLLGFNDRTSGPTRLWYG